MDFEEEEEAVQPHYAQKFRIPTDPLLLATYELFNPSTQTLNLYSERNREIFAEAFIDGNLDTLANLAVKSLAKLGIRGITPYLQARPELMRIFYDAMDVELPLRECYMINDQRFWRRVVLSNTLDKTLHLKRWNEFDWKSEGVSRKFVDQVEACPVNVKPQKKLAQLAEKVWECVTSMHIRKLQVLPDYAFLKYMESEIDDDIPSESSDEEEISSDEPDTELEIEGEGEEEHQSSSSAEPAIVFWHAESENKDTIRRNARHQRNDNRQQARDIIAKKRADRAENRRRREEKKLGLNDVDTTKKKKKKKEPPIQDVFNITVAPEPEDDEDRKPDHRNKILLLERIKRYDYPDSHCHHIDLGFVRYFGNMVSFTLEFLGPPEGKDFQSRYMRFSEGDMVRLSRGLRCLPNLRTFKLRNGRLNVKKFRILARALQALDSLEEVDFGYDQMTDDCSEGLAYLLKRPKMYRIIQLEYNRLGSNSALVLGKALTETQEGVLEYLGLAHNPLNEVAIKSLVTSIIGTPHVMALNISGCDLTSSVIVRDIGNLLRSHTPLISLEMAAMNIGTNQGNHILRALEKNTRVLFADLRECDLTFDQEFEVDMIVRRNNYIHENLLHGENLCAVVKERRHPIVYQIENDISKRKACQEVRPKFSSSSEKSIPEVVEDKKEVEDERDIWAILARWDQPKQHETRVSEGAQVSPHPSLEKPQPFVYEANNFDIEQFRNFVHLPGPGNRFFYLQKNKTP